MVSSSSRMVIRTSTSYHHSLTRAPSQGSRRVPQLGSCLPVGPRISDCGFHKTKQATSKGRLLSFSTRYCLPAHVTALVALLISLLPLLLEVSAISVSRFSTHVLFLLSLAIGRTIRFANLTIMHSVVQTSLVAILETSIAVAVAAVPVTAVSPGSAVRIVAALRVVCAVA